MPLPTPAEMRDRTKTNAQMRELLVQLVESALDRDSANSNALFKPVLLTSENLNDLENGHFLINNPPSNWAELNYPIAGQCYIKVIRASGSPVKHQFIEYPASERKFYRYFNGTIWTVKEIKSTSQLESAINATINANALFKPVLLTSENLNDLENGHFLINNPPSNWAELNYPITGQCYIEVIKASGSLVKHQFIEYPASERKFYRYFNGTIWTVKEIKSTSQLESAINATINANALFKPVLLTSENLNDLENGHFLINNPPSNWAELNYPITGQCYIEVIKASGSLVKHQFIEYPAFERKFYRYFNGTTWSVKEIKSTSQLEALIKDLPTVVTKHARQANLNDLTEGHFIQSNVADATLDRNYPIANQVCFIAVVKNSGVSSAVLQEIYYPTLNRLFYRYFNSSAWVTREISTNIANETITPAMLTKTVSNAITPHLEFVKVGASGNITFTPSTRTLAWTHMILAPYAGVGSRRIRIDPGSIVIPDSAYHYLYIDLNTVPPNGNITADLLKVELYDATGFSVAPNQVPLVKTDGDKKPFSCAGFLPFITLEQTNDLPIAAKDTFKFSKTLSGADIYLPCTDSTRLLRIRFYRQLIAFDGTASQSQSDIWRLGSASLVESETFGIVSSVVQDGEWDTAIRVDGAADHSGGVHGDELQTSSYFLIDGIYYDQDFLIDKEITELMYVQKSNIYFEHTQNILCERLKVMTVTKSGIRNYQKLIFKAVATLQTAWITMLPIRRKLGASNDGANVTDTLIRFPGYELENVAETGFTQVFTPTDADYSYLLFSKVSGVKAKVKFLSMKGLPSPNTHVSSAIQYNKLYFSAIYGRGQTYETKVDEVWELEAEYTFDKS